MTPGPVALAVEGTARHSFASLLVAEGRQPLFVARLGHPMRALLATHTQLIDEYEDRIGSTRTAPGRGGKLVRN